MPEYLTALIEDAERIVKADLYPERCRTMIANLTSEIKQKTSPASAAKILLEHIVYYAMAERLGEKRADEFIAELGRIADGEVKYGAALEDRT